MLQGDIYLCETMVENIRHGTLRAALLSQISTIHETASHFRIRRLRGCTITRYLPEANHRDSLRGCTITRYLPEANHRGSLRGCTITRYLPEANHRDSLRGCTITRYLPEANHRGSLRGLP